jgi:Tfp pilus assembly protein PilN
MNAVIVKRKGSDLIVDRYQNNLSSFQLLKDFLDKNIPLALFIHGKGVLTKLLPFEEAKEKSTSGLLSKVLPNATPSEFNIQVLAVQPETSISVIRASVLNNLLNELRAVDLLSIVNIHIGKIQIQAQANTLEVSVEAFAAALSVFTRNDDGIRDSDLLSSITEEFRQKQKFERRGVTLLVACFLVLLCNYLLFENYRSESNRTAAELDLNKSALHKYEALQQEFDEKTVFLKNNGLLKTSKTSYYADDLAHDLPGEIRWQELNIHPEKKEIDPDGNSQSSYNQNIISLSGWCSKSTALNDWIKALEAKPWISKVELLDYKQDHAKKDGVFQLALSIR